MSNNIDNRIVQMEFDNKDFERGVKESLRSLEILKKGLDLNDSIASLKNLERLANNYDLSGLEKSIKGIGKHFTFLGRNVDKVIDKIASKALHGFTDTAYDVTFGQISKGMGKYETQTKAVQTITNATGKSIQDVEKVLGNLMEYTDQTSYDFSTMAESIGKFTSVGVELERAEKAMEGIANEAALSGANKEQANRAMYNFAQALSLGYVQKMDWRSIENANMATKTFKEEIIKTAIEMGKLNKTTDTSGKLMKGTGKKAKSITVDYKTFADTLSEGWFTSDVLITTLERFANKEEGIGKKAYIAAQKALTYTDALDAIRDAVSSGWMTSFKYLFGNLEEAIDLWTGFCESIISFTSIFSEARNTILKAWHEQGGYNAAIETASNLWGIFMNVVRAAADVFADVFLPGGNNPLGTFGQNLAEATEKVRDLTGEWRKLFGYDTQETVSKTKDVIVDAANEINKNLNRGMKGETVKKLQEELMKAGYYVGSMGADGIYGPRTQAAVEKLQRDLGVKVTGAWDLATKKAVTAQKLFSHVTQITVDEVQQVDSTTDATSRLQKAVRGFASLLHIVTESVKVVFKVVGHILRICSPLLDAVLTILAAIGDGIYYLDEFLKKTGAFEILFEAIKIILTPIEAIFKGIGVGTELIRNAIKGIPDLVKKINLKGISKIFSKMRTTVLTLSKKIEETVGFAVKNISGKILNGISWIIVNVPKLVKIAASFIGKIKETIIGSEKLQNVWSKIKTFFQGAWDTIKLLTSSISEAFKGKNTLSSLIDKTDGKKLFNNVKKWIDKIRKAVSNLIADLKKKVDSFRKSNPIIDKILSSVEGAIKRIKEFAKLFKNSVYSFFTKKIPNGMKNSPLDILKYKLAQLKPILNWFKAGKDKIVEYINTIVNGLKGKSLIEIIRNIADSVKKYAGIIKDGIIDFFKGGINVEALKEKFKGLEPVLNWLVALKDQLIEGVYSLLHPFASAETLDGAKESNSVLDYIKIGVDKVKEIYSSIKDKVDVDKLIGMLFGFFALRSVFKVAKAIGSIGSGLSGIGEGIGKGVSDIGAGISSIAKGFPSIGENLGESIKQSVEEYSKALKKSKKDPIGDTILKIAGAVALIAVSVFILSKTDAEKAQKGMIVFAEALGAIVAAMLIISPIASKVKGVGKDALMLTGSIGVLALSLWLMTKVIGRAIKNPSVLAASLLIIVGLLGELGLIEVAISKAGKGKTSGVKGVLQLALGVYVIVAALGKLIKIVDKNADKPDAVNKSLAIIAGMVLGLGAVEFALAKANKGGKGFKISGIIGLAAGLWLIVSSLVRVVKTFNKYGEKTMLDSFLMLEILLVTVGIIAKVVGSNGGGIKKAIASIVPMIAFGFAIKSVVNSFIKIIKAFNKYGEKTMLDSFLMLEILMATVGLVAIAIVKNSNNAFGALAGAISIAAMGWTMGEIVKAFGNAISMISGVNPEILSIFFVGVETAIGVLAAIVIAFGNMPVQVLLGSLGLVAVMGALAAGVAIIAEVGKDVITKFGDALWIIGSKLQDFNTFTKDVDMERVSTICTTLMDNLSSLVTRLTEFQTAVAIEKATELTEIGAQIALFDTNISGIGPKSIVSSEISKKLANDGKLISDTIAAITVSDQFNNGVIERVGAQVSNYSGSIANIDTTKSEDAKTLATDAKSVADTIGLITLADGVSTTLTNVGGALKLYYQSLEGINLDDNGNVKKVDSEMIAQAFTSISGAIPQDSINQIMSFTTGGDNDMSVLAIGITNLGTALSSYKNDIGGIKSEEVKAANDVIDAVKGIGARFDASGVNDLSTSFTATDSDLSKFADDVVILGTAIGNYATSIGGINSTEVETANNVINKVKGLEDSLKKVTWDDVLGFLKGKRESITSFGGDMITLGVAIGNYATKIKGISWDGINKSSKVIDVVVDLQNRLPVTGQFWTFITGSKNMNDFSSNMSTLGDGLAGYANKVSAADFTNVDDSLGYVERLGGVFAKLDKHGGVVSWFGGDKDLSVLSKGMTKVGEDLVSFQGAVESFDVNSVQSAFDTIQKVIDMQNSIDWSTTNASGLEAVGNSFRMMLNEIAAVTGEKAWKNNKATVLDAVKEVGESIVLNVSSGITSASDGDGSPKKAFNQLLADVEKAANALLKDNNSPFKTVGGGIAESLNEGINEKHRLPIVSFSNILASMLQAVYNSSISFRNIGGNPVDYFASGISNRRRGPIDNFTGIITSMVNSGYNRNGDFYNLGKNFDNGLANGIYDQSWYPIDAFKSVVNRAFSAGKRAADSHSPSRKTMWLGEMMDLGLVVGLQNYSGKVDSASEAVINSAMSTAQMGLRAVASVLEGGVDDTLTIRPVLDLTDIQAGASSIGGLFGPQTVGIRSANIAGRIAVTDSENAANASNDNSGLSDAVSNLNNEINELRTSITNMQVVMDNGALVGQISSGVDRNLGRSKFLAGRMN